MTDTFMAVGGIALRLERYHEITEKVKELNKRYGVRHELKWATIRKNDFAAARAYADYLFDLIGNNVVHFHVLMADFSKFDHSGPGLRKKIDSVSKMYWQLILHRCVKKYGHLKDLHIRPDDGPCTAYLPNMKLGFNREAKRRFNIDTWPVRTIEPRNSSREPILNLNDVVLGAMCARKNERHLLPKASVYKTTISSYVLAKTRLSSYNINTPHSRNTFSLWNFDPWYIPSVSWGYKL